MKVLDEMAPGMREDGCCPKFPMLRGVIGVGGVDAEYVPGIFPEETILASGGPSEAEEGLKARRRTSGIKCVILAAFESTCTINSQFNID